MLSPLYLALFENVLIGFLFLTETLNLICSLLKYFFLIVFIFATMSPDIVGSGFFIIDGSSTYCSHEPITIFSSTSSSYESKLKGEVGMLNSYELNDPDKLPDPMFPFVDPHY